MNHVCRLICYIDKDGQRHGVCFICDQEKLMQIHDDTNGTYDYRRVNETDRIILGSK